RRGALEHGSQNGSISGLARWAHGPPDAGCGVDRRDPGAYWAVAQLRLPAGLGAGATRPGAAAGAAGQRQTSLPGDARPQSTAGAPQAAPDARTTPRWTGCRPAQQPALVL